MSSGERPIGAAKGKQPNAEALCQPPFTPFAQKTPWYEGEKRLCNDNWPLIFGSIQNIIFPQGKFFWFWVEGWFGLEGGGSAKSPPPPPCCSLDCPPPPPQAGGCPRQRACLLVIAEGSRARGQ